MTTSGIPSSRQLLRHALLALCIAAAVLTGAILPAEFGIDPTGLGARLGLTVLHSPPSASAAPTPAQVVQHAAPWQEDSLTLTLAPMQGAELKAVMESGESFVFHWRTDNSPLYFDMHGERPDAAKDEFTSYWEAQAQSEASGQFTAPFAGSHGWYWQNNSTQPVTLHLRVAGFYRTIYMP